MKRLEKACLAGVHTKIASTYFSCRTSGRKLDVEQVEENCLNFGLFERNRGKFFVFFFSFFFEVK